MTPDPISQILITPEAFQRLKFCIEICPSEISGLGRVEPYENNLLISEVFILKQKVSSSDTELDPEGVCQLLSRFIQEGRDPSSIRLWWHSHGEMDVEWSDTDEKTIHSFNGDYMVSVMGNKQGQFLCRLDFFSPERRVMEGLPLVPLAEDGGSDELALRESIEAEIQEKVRAVLPIEHLISGSELPNPILYLEYQLPLKKK